MKSLGKSRFQAKITPEHIQDLSQHFGIDLEEELQKILKQEIENSLYDPIVIGVLKDDPFLSSKYNTEEFYSGLIEITEAGTIEGFKKILDRGVQWVG